MSDSDVGAGDERAADDGCAEPAERVDSVSGLAVVGERAEGVVKAGAVDSGVPVADAVCCLLALMGVRAGGAASVSSGCCMMSAMWSMSCSWKAFLCVILPFCASCMVDANMDSSAGLTGAALMRAAAASARFCSTRASSAKSSVHSSAQTGERHRGESAKHSSTSARALHSSVVKR